MPQPRQHPRTRGIPSFSRPAEVDMAFGKFDARLDELRMPSEVVDELERRWRADGYPSLTAWRRDLYYSALYGVDHVESLRNRKMRDAMGNVVHPASRALAHN